MSIKTLSTDGDEPTEDELTEDQREMLEYVRENSDRLEAVVDRMLQEDESSGESNS